MLNGTADDASMDRTAVLLFNWVEYSVFCSMLVLSLLIGVYYGWFKKQDTVAEYMLGGKKMSVFPVTMSLIFSHVSGITFLGAPAEVYQFGTQYYSIIICNFLILFLVNYLYLPVFYELQLNSLYEYLELRFDKSTRTLASFVFTIALVTFIPVVIYIPALAFNQVTGVSVHVITPIVTLICIFYTLFGGLRAVVWTDALQSVFTIGSTVFIIYLGLQKFDSIAEVFEINRQGHRLEFFNMDPNPFERNTFWTVVLGYSVIWASNIAVHPGAVQRFIAVSTFREAKMVMVYSSIIFFFIIHLVTFVGLLLYATYHDCDPVATKRIRVTGQVLPYFVMEVAKDYSGLAGLFISGVLSAALSTMSASLNTVAGTIYEDLIQPLLSEKKQTDTKQNVIIKMIVLVLGLFCILMVFVVERLGAIFQMAMSIFGLTNGILFGIFTLGIFFPRANPKGAFWGCVSGIVVVAVVMWGAQFYKTSGLLRFPGKVTSVDGCPATLMASLAHNASTLVETYTGVGSPVEADDSVPYIFRLSYMYYALLGTLVICVVGLLVSYFTEQPEPRCLDPKLFAPPVRRFLPKSNLHYIVSRTDSRGDFVLVSNVKIDSEVNL